MATGEMDLVKFGKFCNLSILMQLEIMGTFFKGDFIRKFVATGEM
jgi:hypothetical protein